MEGKLFLLDKGHVIARNGAGMTASFNTVDDFYKYYSGKIDLSGEYYIDYEPDNKLFYYNNDPKSLEALSNRYGENPFVKEYEAVIDDVEKMVDKLKDPYFGLGLKEAKEYKLDAIKGLTYRTITSRLPQWKQAKWNEYIRIYEKHERGETLTRLEQAVFDAFPGEGETHRSRYEDAVKAMEWILKCVAVNNKKEEELKKARGIKTIRGIEDPSYPAWPL
jgi:hypothetical protein